MDFWDFGIPRNHLFLGYTRWELIRLCLELGGFGFREYYYNNLCFQNKYRSLRFTYYNLWRLFLVLDLVCSLLSWLAIAVYFSPLNFLLNQLLKAFI
jgi:hypothetical protein